MTSYVNLVVAAAAVGMASRPDGYWLSGEWHTGNFNPEVVIDTSHVSVSP